MQSSFTSNISDESAAQKALVNLNLKPIPNTTRVFKLNWASTNHNNKTEHSVYVGELSEDVSSPLESPNTTSRSYSSPRKLF